MSAVFYTECIVEDGYFWLRNDQLDGVVVDVGPVVRPEGLRPLPYFAELDKEKLCKCEVWP